MFFSQDVEDEKKEKEEEIVEKRDNIKEEMAYILSGKVCYKSDSGILVGKDSCDLDLVGIVGDVSFSITEDASIIDEDGKEMLINDIQVGDIVSVWITGYILESFPAQATAEKIVLRDENRPIGEVACYETTENTATVSYTIKNGKKTSLVRDNKVIATWNDEFKEGLIVDEGLFRSTLYNYYLINDEQELFLDLLDRTGCRTKFQDKAKTREDCIQDIEDAEEIMREVMSAKYTEEPMKKYMKCGDVLLYESPLASGGRFLKERDWEEISKSDWGLETEKEKITMDVSDIDSYSPNFIDCPDIIDDSVSSNIIMQHIEGDVYKWERFDLGNDNYCIILERPEEKRLSGEEARVLMEKSRGQ